MQDLVKLVERDIKQHRTRIFSEQPLYAILLSRLNSLVVTDGQVMGRKLPTAATDGKCIYVNAPWYWGLPRESRFPLFLHELLHVALGHNYRRGNRNERLWGIACDYVINLIIRELKMYIPDWYCDTRFLGLSEEKVYAILEQEEQAKQKPQQQDCSPDSDSDYEDASPDSSGDDESDPDEYDETPEDSDGREDTQDDSGSDDEPEESEEDSPSEDSDEAGTEPGNDQADSRSSGSSTESTQGDTLEDPPDDNPNAGQVWDASGPQGEDLTEEELAEEIGNITRDLQMADIAAKQAGVGASPSMQVSIDRLARPRMNWQSYLRKWIVQKGKPKGRTWSKLDRRGLQRGVIIPGEIHDGLDWLVVAVDISYSISMPEYKAFMENLDKIRQEISVRRLTVLPFNDRISTHQIVDLTGNEPTPKELRIGGGTMFSPIFNWVRRESGNPSAVMVFTDMCCEDWGMKPSCPVLWASTEEAYQYNHRGEIVSNNPPFGEVVHIDLSN